MRSCEPSVVRWRVMASSARIIALSAIDLNSGEYVWKINLGKYPDLLRKELQTGERRVRRTDCNGWLLSFVLSMIHWGPVMGNDTSVCRERNSCNVFSERPPVCSYRCRRRQEFERIVGRCVCGLRFATGKG